MKNVRIIPRLDIKGPNLVKGIHLEGLRVLGKPETFSKMYYEHGADELIYQDTVASLYQRNNLTEIINRTVQNIYVPLTVGGGIRSLSDINLVLRAGADKIAVNTAAIKNPNFVNEASKSFGRSTIVIAIEAIKEKDGTYLAYTDNGREYTGMDVISWAKQVEDRGAGELLITSIDNEGTGKGFDNKLVKLITDIVKIPVIAHGGCGNVQDIVSVVNDTKVDAIAIASALHYAVLNQGQEHILKDFKDEGNVEFLKNKKTFTMFGTKNLNQLKNEALKKGISVRPSN